MNCTIGQKKRLQVISFNLFAVDSESAKEQGGIFRPSRIAAPSARYNSVQPSRPTTIACHRTAGFTLAETLVAVMIFSVVSTALCLAISFSMATTRSAQENVRASQIMVDKMEYLRLCTWAQITNDTSIPKTFTEVFDPSSTNGSMVMSGRISISPVLFNNNFATNMRLVTLSLDWKSKRAESRQMQTFVSRDGLERYGY